MRPPKCNPDNKSLERRHVDDLRLHHGINVHTRQDASDIRTGHLLSLNIQIDAAHRLFILTSLFLYDKIIPFSSWPAKPLWEPQISINKFNHNLIPEPNSNPHNIGNRG